VAVELVDPRRALEVVPRGLLVATGGTSLWLLQSELGALVLTSPSGDAPLRPTCFMSSKASPALRMSPECPPRGVAVVERLSVRGEQALASPRGAARTPAVWDLGPAVPRRDGAAFQGAQKRVILRRAATRTRAPPPAPALR